MIRSRRCLVGTIVMGILLATAVGAVAETFTLTLKRREAKAVSSDPTSYAYWTVRPQYLYVQMTADEKGRWRPVGPESRTDAFKRIVKKEPKYQSENPFRGVAKLGRTNSPSHWMRSRRRPPRPRSRTPKKPRRRTPQARRSRGNGDSPELAAESEAPSTSAKPGNCRPSRRFRRKLFATIASTSISITTAI